MSRRSRAVALCAISLCCVALVLSGCRQTVTGEGEVSTLSPAATSTPPPTTPSTPSAPTTPTVPSGTTSNTATSTAGSATIGGASTGAVGETVQAGGWTMRVLGTEFVTKIKGSAVSGGKVALRVTAQMKNPTPTTTDVAKSLVLRSGGKAIAPSPKGGPALVPGGQTINVTVYFPLQQQGAGYKLIFTEPGGTKTAMVTIN